MRIIYFGTAAFAVPALEALASDVVLVVSQPDRPGGRGMKLQSSPVKEAAVRLGIPVETPEKSRAPEFAEVLRSLQPDILVVAAYGQILSQKVLDSAMRGGINLHGSILPHYRGAAPIQRAVLNEESETGVTLMQMDKGMDTGDSIAEVRTPIGPDETYGELQDRLSQLAADMAKTWMPRIFAGDYPRTPQDHGQATHAPKVEKVEAELSFTREAKIEYARFRAFTPSPGPYIQTRLGSIRLSRLAFHSNDNTSPGTVVQASPRLVVSFSSGALEFVELQPEGKKRMRGSDFANGARLRAGDSLL
jgi:methionyl-tRNA formyltransferase